MPISSPRMPAGHGPGLRGLNRPPRSSPRRHAPAHPEAVVTAARPLLARDMRMFPFLAAYPLAMPLRRAIP